jgi:hypothetical protein
MFYKLIKHGFSCTLERKYIFRFSNEPVFVKLIFQQFWDFGSRKISNFVVSN